MNEATVEFFHCVLPMYEEKDSIQGIEFLIEPVHEGFHQMNKLILYEFQNQKILSSPCLLDNLMNLAGM